jgi:multicomponent Na+:H+ antiporter subunit C
VNLVYAASIAALMGGGVYLLLSRHVMRILLGVMTLSASVNLAIFVAGRIGTDVPPVIPSGSQVLGAHAANPLPQALILTAIVIGFSLTAFLAALILKAQRAMGTVDSREIDDAERMGSPFGNEGDDGR